MDLVIESGPGEKTSGVYRALREAIVDGRLPAGHRLPATRMLAADLGVGRNSVATAYERLVAEGYLTARVGAGTFVAPVRSRPAPRRAAADPLRPRAGWTFTPVPVSGAEPAPRYDFRTGIPDAGLFPVRLLAAAGRRRGAAAGEQPRHVRRPGRSSRVACGDRPLPGRFPVGAGEDRGRADHQRHPARARPDRPGPAAAR